MIDWHAFLHRPPLLLSPSLEPLRDQSILITGAGGSIGSSLSLRFASIAPRRLVLLDASEQALYRLQQQLDKAPSSAVVTILGSVNDALLLDEICTQHKPTLVFHAAAHKHSPLLEQQPLAAIDTNTIGTMALTGCLRRHNSPRLILLSTDKAADPTSMLGATKRVAERITLAYGGIALRLANVLGSEGSVVETFLHQIRNHGPITITHPDANRFFLTIAETVDLLITAATSGRTASLLIPSLQRSYRIRALAEFLAAMFSPSDLIEYRYTGLRLGDKLQESLSSAGEHADPSGLPGLAEVRSSCEQDPNPVRQFAQLEKAVRERSFHQAMEALFELVPTYQPSAHIQQLVDQSRPGVAAL